MAPDFQALEMNEPDGFQVVAEARSHRLSKAQIIGPDASLLIASIAVQNGLSLGAITNSVHAHPTLPKGLKEQQRLLSAGRSMRSIDRSNCPVIAIQHIPRSNLLETKKVEC